MKKQLLYIMVKVEPEALPIFETKEQEQEYRDKITREIKEKFSNHELVINFATKQLK